MFRLALLIGAANVACKCCCKEDAGKCAGCAIVVLNSIAFIGSCIDFYILGWIIAICEDNNQEPTDVCNIGLFAFLWWGGAG